MLSRNAFITTARLLAVLLGAGNAGAACLVLGGGAAYEVRTIPERRGALMIFQDRNGRLTSLRVADVDTAATEQANRRGVCGQAGAGGAVARDSRASPLRDTSRAVAIDGPTGLGPHSPTASEIAAAMPATAAGKPVGPPPGASIDCGVVECGKFRPEVASPARRDAPKPAQVEESTQPPSANSAPESSSARKLFGEGFHWSEPAEAPAPRPVAPRKPPRRG